MNPSFQNWGWNWGISVFEKLPDDSSTSRAETHWARLLSARTAGTMGLFLTTVAPEPKTVPHMLRIVDVWMAGRVGSKWKYVQKGERKEENYDVRH